MNKIILSTCVLFAIITGSVAQTTKTSATKPAKTTSKGQKSKPAANAQKETTSVVDQSATTASSSQEKFTVKLRTPSYTAGLTYLCYHMGKNLNIEDSALITEINNEGVAVFTGERKLQGGIYAIVFPGRNITFDFFVDKEQNIEIYADSITPMSFNIIKGSRENDLFQQYQSYVSIKGGMMQKERMAYNTSTTKQDSTLHEGNYIKFSKELNNYRDTLMKNQPNSMMTLMLNAMREPDLPVKKPLNKEDSLYNYYYYKSHYWDGITFTNDRILRTPFFLPKLERYYREVMIQSSDSIIKDLDYKLLLCRTTPEMYKFLLNWLTDEYMYPKYMGQDAILVHLFEKYHSKGISNWLNEKQKEAISKRAYMVMSNLIGAKAANLNMIDSTGKLKPLDNLVADYTLVIFWDPTCGHCRVEVPRIDSIYRASWKAHGLRIYSVLSDNDKKKEWVQYIKENNIGDWTNVYETPEMEKAIADAQLPGFRQLYDVTQTPTILLLDKDKRIIGKKLSWEQLNDFLETKWSEKKH